MPSLTPSRPNELMGHYNPPTPTTAAFCPSAAPSPQVPETSLFSTETAIKDEDVEVDTDMRTNNNFLEATTVAVSESHSRLRASFIGHVEGRPSRLQDDEHDPDLDSSSCFSSPYMSSEAAFDSSSFTRLLSRPVSRTEEEPSTRPSSSLRNYYTAEQDRNDDQEDDDDQQQQQQCHYRESSIASVVTSRFSGLSLAPVAEPPLMHASSLSSEISNAYLAPAQAPFTFSSSSSISTFFPPPGNSSTFNAGLSASLPATFATAASSSAPSSVYFPPTASALHQKRRKALKQKIQVPRPKNCFMLYRSRVLPMIMAELGSINNKIISKIAAERWRAESEPVKVWYRDMAKYGKEEHARMNPGYKYAPQNRMRMMAATAVGCLVQRHEKGEDKRTIVVNGDDVEVDRNDAADEDYVDGSASNRRRSTRQCSQQLQQQQQPIASRSGLRSQVSKKRNSAGLGLDVQSSSSSFSTQNKRPRDAAVHHQASYPPSNLSTDSLSTLHSYSAETTGFPSTFQTAHPLAGPTSIYNLTADKNASEETLVDPIDHWTTHRYQDDRNYFDHPSTLSSSLPLSNPYKTKLVGASMLSPAKLVMIDPKIMMEKELPPLPHEMSAAQHGSHGHSYSQSHNSNTTNKNAMLPPLPASSSFQSNNYNSNNNSNDPDSIMTQMFLQYNPPAIQQQHHRQSQSQHHYQLHMHEQNPFQQAFQQHTQQQQYHHQQYQQHQHQHQHQYFIKPAAAYPTGFMSFTDVAAAGGSGGGSLQGSMSFMDMLASPWAKS
ncbi:hypothetical protein BGW39_007104 [Mortierella sp. 14UC]|nr:hypothetical protein BGW39_007104 [Mortierella sp. 14UC]